MARRTLTDTTIAALKPKSKRYTVADPLLPGHYVRVSPTGAKTFAVIARDPRGKQVLATIGAAAIYPIAQAREKAREAIKAIKAGEDHAGPQSFESVASQWLKHHVEARGLRSAARASPLSRQAHSARMGRSGLHLDPPWRRCQASRQRRGLKWARCRRPHAVCHTRALQLVHYAERELHLTNRKGDAPVEPERASPCPHP